ncbi:MAG: hypothetical protein ACRDT2_14485 [Natronosporangium sp.]
MRTVVRSKKALIGGLLAAGLVSLGCSVSSDLVTYELPPESQRYTLEVENDGVLTSWEYMSERPATDQEPEHHPCLETELPLSPVEQPCRPEPLIFLRYELGVDVANTLPAGRSARVTITGYYTELESEPDVTELSLAATFDGGQSWQPVPTRPAGDGTFTATIPHPRLDRTDGSVGLRVNATDSDGNTVAQTVPTAYHLR